MRSAAFSLHRGCALPALVGAVFVCASLRAEDWKTKREVDDFVGAAYVGDFATVKDLVRLAPVKGYGYEKSVGEAALDGALMDGHKDIAAFLIEHGVPIEYWSKQHFLDDLTTAAYDGDFATVKALKHILREKCHSTEQTAGEVALAGATLQGHDDIAAYLLEQGVPIANTSDAHDTTLGNCAGSHCLKTIRLLLRRGVHANVKDWKGWTALMIAAHKDDVEVMKLLIQDPSTKLHLRNGGGETALHIAAYSNSVEAVRYLVRQGFDTSIKDDEGRTAEECARRNLEDAWEGARFRGKAEVIVRILHESGKRHPL